jgi:murein DD-endopeptidase MepM/ murein hydrolase activator NlpD
LTTGPLAPTRPRGAVPALVAFLLALALSGCRSPDDGAAAEAPPAQAATTTPPTTRPQPSTTRSTGFIDATPSSVTNTPSTPPSSDGEPGRAAARYVFPVTGCRVSFGSAHHDYPASDIFAPAGCRVVAPTDGVVDEVSRTDRWDPATDRGADRGGLSVSVVGDDGVRYYSSHLRSLATKVRPGLRVEAGELLGRVGNTGSARGVAPHLHFGLSWPTPPGIWWVRRGMVPPARFLTDWQGGGELSPRQAVRAARAEAGTTVPRCRARC